MTLVLVLDGDPVVRGEVLACLSGYCGISVAAAASPAEARAVWRKTPPDFVVLGVPLPSASLAELRQELAVTVPAAAVLILSQSTEELGDMVLGRNTFLDSKPVNPHRLRLLARRYARASSLGIRFSVPDIIQMVCVGGHSALIECRRDAKTVGTVTIVDGQIRTAVHEQESGLEAMVSLVDPALTGKPKELVQAPEAGQFSISWQELLFEATRLHDEQNASRPPGFDELVMLGGQALLTRDYARAAVLFTQAAEQRPDDKVVQVNLERLRSMGFGGE